jgi:hypothetical protein
MKVKAKLKVLKHQLEFLNCRAQYPALVAGYGSGKTEAGIIKTINMLKTYGLSFKLNQLGIYNFGIYEPTYDLIKVILFARFEQILSSMQIKYILNKTDKTLYIPQFNAKIIFRSLENDDRIIGYEHGDFWIDELDTLKKDKAKSAFEKIVARNRQKKPYSEINTGCITTTPEGFKFVYEKWAKCDILDAEKFVIIKGKTENNIFLPPSYIEDLMRQYPANLISAYLNGEFVNLNNANVYSNFNRDINSTELLLKHTADKKELHIGMDFNVDHMAAVIAIHNEEDNELIVVEEFVDLFDTNAMIDALKDNYEDYIINIYPDAAGNQRKTNNASTSDIHLLRSAGFRIHVNKTNPRIKDRVMAVNSLFLNGQGESRLFINIKKCPKLTENIEQQSYDPKTGQPDKTQGQDHVIDALGYMVEKLYPIKRQLHL